MGATHYVTVNFDEEAKELESRYKVLEKTDKYEIIKLGL